MGNFYLCNEFGFLINMGMSNVTPSSGTHMKIADVNKILKNHPNYSYLRVRHTPRGNDYVVSTKMKFVGNDNNIVNTIDRAKVFPTPEEAYKYLDLNAGTIDSDIIRVIDEKYHYKKRTTPKIEIEVDPSEMISFNKMETSERVKIPQYVKEDVYKKSGGVCAICGKTLSKYSYTVDHITPLSRGGTNEPDNLRAVHCDCNQLKGKFLDAEMRKAALDTTCRTVYIYPTTKAFAMIARGFMRGIINKYENRE